jgi:hypothetical protein
MSSDGVKYELAEKVRGITCGGIGMLRRLAEDVGLVLKQAITLAFLAQPEPRSVKRPSSVGGVGGVELGVVMWFCWSVRTGK